MPRSWMIALGVAFCAATPFSTHAQNADDPAIDWPMFQGNMQRTGACDYPAIERPTIAWSTRVGIMGYLNNPVIDGDRVYVGSSGSAHNTPDDLDGVYCLDLNTGEILWHRPTETDACGVAIDATHVFAGDDSGLLQALDRETGEVAWSLRSGSRAGLIDAEGEMVVEFEGGASSATSVFAQPLLVGGLVIVGDSNGLVYAVQQETGEVAWLGEGRPGVQTLQPHQLELRGGLSSDGETLFGVLVGGYAFSLNIDGELRWHWEVGVDWAEFYGAPTIADDRVILAAAGYSWDSPQLTALDTATGKVLWDNHAKPGNGNGRYYNLRTSPAVYNGILFYGETASSRLIGVEADTGDPIWHDPVGVPAYVQWASPVIAGDVMYLARPDGALYALLASDRTPEWSVYLGDHDRHGHETPAAVRNHQDPWSKPTVGDSLYATPAIARDGTIVAGSGDGWLYCIREQE